MEQTETTDRSQIGKAGEPSANGSQASRAAHIAIDRRRVGRYDPMYRHDARLIRNVLTWRVVFLLLGIWLIWMLQWWTITLGVLSLGAALFLFWVADVRDLWRGVRTRCELYWDSLLIGSVVVRTHPLTVLGVTSLETGTGLRTVYRYFDGWDREISKAEYEAGLKRAEEEWNREWSEKYLEADDPEDERIWNDFWEDPRNVFEKREDEEATERAAIHGCQLCVVGDGDWSDRYRVGSRMPCSSAYGSEDDEAGIWRSMDVIPLVWGTGNEPDLAACTRAIDESEWEMLEQIAPLAEGLEVDELYRIHREPEGSQHPFRLEPIDDEEEYDEEENDD